MNNLKEELFKQDMQNEMQEGANSPTHFIMSKQARQRPKSCEDIREPQTSSTRHVKDFQRRSAAKRKSVGYKTRIFEDPVLDSSMKKSQILTETFYAGE